MSPEAPELRSEFISALAAEIKAFKEMYTALRETDQRAITAALLAAEKAVGVAERNSERWRDSANEWRAAMTDKDRNFVTKNALWGYFVGIIGIVIPVALLIAKIFTH